MFVPQAVSMSSICFAIDGAKVSAPQHLPPSTRLVEFIRDHARIKSVKVGCGEGGCGSCSVLVTRLDTDTGETSTSVVNSCLATIASVDGCAITTSSGLGSSKKGFHRVQEAIAARHGSQCGFCTPGISVACAAALQRCSAAGAQPTAEALVAGLDGNLCRCTGWRPIVDACKDLADIEDCHGAPAGCAPGQQAPVMPQWLRDYAGRQHASRQHAARSGAGRASAPLRVLGCSGGQQWAEPASLQELLALMAQWRGQGFRLVAGNTGAGVVHDWPHEAHVISVAHVAEMREAGWREGGLQLGGATTLAETIQLLRAPEAPAAAVQQLGALAQHLEQVAGHPVRNAATLGGHLALLKARPFQSDVATLLVAAGAQLCLSSAQQGHVWTSVMQLLAPATSVDWHEAVISCLHLPTPPPCSWVWSARQALRRSNAHALVNLAMLLQLEGVEEVEAGSGSAAGQQPAGRLADRVVRSAVIAYGGETASGGWCCGRALQAEQMVAKGQTLTAAALISALEALSADLCPQQPSGYASEALQGLLLQALAPLVDCAQLSLQQPELARLIAGAVPLPPPGLPEGRREVPDFSDAASAPVGAPVAKDGVLLQASGEALYSSDASAAGMLYAAVVLSPAALARLDGVDASQALELPGVLACLTAEDIPSGPDTQVLGCDLLAWQQVLYVGQPVALVLAESQALAERAAQLVQVHVSRPPEMGQPIITIADAIAAGSYWDVPDLQQGSGSGRDSSSAPSASKASWGEALASRPGTAAPLSGGIYLQRQGQQRGSAPGKARLVQAVVRQAGDMRAAMARSTHRLEAQRYSLPSQQHMFMETQAAVAEPVEGGGMRVVAGSQSLDAVQLAVAQVLQLPHHQVTAITGRVGGAFGGKASRAPPVAALAALAAHASGRPVSLVLPRDVDLATTCGRSAAELLYDVGYEPDGTINAIDMKAWFQGGAFLDLGWGDVLGLAQGVDVAYDLAALRLEARYCRCHLPPRTIMRAPGMVQAAMVMEQVMEVVARQLRLDPWLVKQRNFLPLPEGPHQMPSSLALRKTAVPAAPDDAVHPTQEAAVSTTDMQLLDLGTIAGALPLPAEQPSAAATDLIRWDDEPACSSSPSARQGAAVLGRCSTRQEAGDHPRSCDPRLLQLLYGAKAGSSTAGSGPGSKVLLASSSHSSSSSSSSAARCHAGASTCGAAAPVVRTILGRTLLAQQYTLPRIWRQLAETCQYTQRQQALAAFNASSPWVKRGMAITPSRFDCAPSPMSAAVSVYADGSVLVSHGGVEMGQGLATKVKQVAVHALSQLLPREQRPLPLELIKVAASSSDVVPNGGPTWSSTGSESACEAVRRACGQVTSRLQPHLQLAEDGLQTWADTVAAVHPAPGLTPASAMLSAYGFFDGAASDGRQMQYSTFGAACCEAEVDLLTGARRVLRVDMLVDCGRSINPAVDIGQLEGGFVQGLGMMVCEQVLLHEGTGELLTGSTWQYKIPTPDMLPAQFNVTLLPDSPNTRGVLGSKASGEPGVMLSAVVASALQAAAAAAMDDPAMSAGSGGASSTVLATPATPSRVVHTRLLCCGALLSLLRAAGQLP